MIYSTYSAGKLCSCEDCRRRRITTGLLYRHYRKRIEQRILREENRMPEFDEINREVLKLCQKR